MDRDDRIAALARSYLFAGLPREQLSSLAAVATTRRLDRGEVLIRVGDRADELYVVSAGELKDTVVDADGNEVVHFLHGPGMTLGEPGFFAADHRRIVEVAATGRTVVIRLDRRDLVPFMARHPSTKDRVLEKLASNQRWQTSMISSLATKSLPDRLILRLLELVDSNATREDGLAVGEPTSRSCSDGRRRSSPCNHPVSTCPEPCPTTRPTSARSALRVQFAGSTPR